MIERFWVISLLLKTEESWDFPCSLLHTSAQPVPFPCGPVAETPGSQCRGPGFDPWWENQIPQAATKSLHAVARRPGTAYKRKECGKQSKAEEPHCSQVTSETATKSSHAVARRPGTAYKRKECEKQSKAEKPRCSQVTSETKRLGFLSSLPEIECDEWGERSC